MIERDSPTLFLLVGLPGAGKTTRAKRLEREEGALRLSPDEWMIPLFGESDANGVRDVLEGRLIAIALRALELGVSVILDFGFWSRDERSALRSLAALIGAAAVVVYLPVDEKLQQQRVEGRFGATPMETFPLSTQDLADFRAQFETPDATEISGRTVDAPPPGWATWAEYANARWPSLNFFVL